MRTEYVTAESQAEAIDQCPWAAKVIEVDSGDQDERRWVCFESVEDARMWQNGPTYSDRNTPGPGVR